MSRSAASGFGAALRRPTLAAALLAACHHEVPSYLDGPLTAPAAPTWDGSSRTAAMRSLLRDDVLARVVRVPSDPSQLDDIGLADLRRVLERVVQTPRDLSEAADALEQLEVVEPDYAVWIRGRALALADQQLMLGPSAYGWPLEPTALLSPLKPARDDQRSPVPLAWLGSLDDLTVARRYGDRWVLSGWFASPGLDLDAAAYALEVPVFDALRASPHGQLLTARASGATADASAGLDALRRATRYALEETSADRDEEQKAWREKASTLTPGGEPIRTLLHEAAASLTTAAGDDAAAGGALIALEALRWRNACDDAPCGGVDRTSAILSAAAWSPTLAPLGATWRVITLKTAVDGYDVGRTTIRHRLALVDLIDALIGLGCPHPPADLPLRRADDPYLWLNLGNMLGGQDLTSWETLRPVLMTRLADEAKKAWMSADAEEKELLSRIENRARR